MEGCIFDAAGTGRQLPVLLGWDVSHGFCSPCDCFEARFLYTPEMLEPLRAACRFRGTYQGKTVFSGVVDELELTADARGRTAVLRGRGMQALLLDNQAESADYAAADLPFLLRRHAALLGPAGVAAGGDAGRRAALSVSAGESHWSVLHRFCEFCLGLRPRFSPEGVLLLDGAESGRQFSVGGDTPVGAQRFLQDRYGVLSAAVVHNRVCGTRVTVENPTFQALGGHCVRVVNVPRKTGFDAMRHTGAYQIARSAADMVCLRVTLPACFAAFPGDAVTLAQSPLGLGGEFLVERSRCFADGQAAGTVLELRPRQTDRLEK